MWANVGGCSQHLGLWALAALLLVAAAVARRWRNPLPKAEREVVKR